LKVYFGLVPFFRKPTKFLQKTEELTLHTIKLEKNKKQAKEILSL
jgi:hypothetical protein